MVSIDAGKISSNQIGGIFYGTKVPFGLTSSNNSIEIKFTSRFSWATNVFKFMLFTTDGPGKKQSLCNREPHSTPKLKGPAQEFHSSSRYIKSLISRTTEFISSYILYQKCWYLKI